MTTLATPQIEPSSIDFHEIVDGEYKRTIGEIRQRIGPRSEDSAGCTPPAWLDSYLSTSLEQITTTRSLFMDDARNLVTLVLAIFVASALLASYGASLNDEAEFCLVMLASILTTLLVIPLKELYLSKTRAAYDLYISSILHACVIHEAVGLEKSNLWFYHVKRSIRCLRYLPKNAKESLAQDIVGPFISRGENITQVQLMGELAVRWKSLIAYAWRDSDGDDAHSDKSTNLLKSFKRLIDHVVRVAWLAAGLLFCFSVFRFAHLPTNDSSVSLLLSLSW